MLLSSMQGTNLMTIKIINLSNLGGRCDDLEQAGRAGLWPKHTTGLKAGGI